MPTFDSSSLSRPAGSLRFVAPPAFSFMPAVIMTSAAPVRSEYSPSQICTTDESAAPYWRSVTTAFARLRSRFTTTISRATPRRTLDKRQAEPTAPAPITPIFIWLPRSISQSSRVRWQESDVHTALLGRELPLEDVYRVEQHLR